MRNCKITLASLSIILLQSCTVYHNSSASLEEAVDKGKVKVVSSYGQVLKLDKVVQKDSVYYGVGKNDTVRISSIDLSEIHLIDRRKSHDFKNRVFITTGIMPRTEGILGSIIGEYRSYGSYNINYERKINNHFSSRLLYGKSFNSKSLLFGETESGQRTFYMATLGFTTHKNNSHLEINVGYALIHEASHEEVDFYYYSPSYIQESRYLHSPVLEVGYRLTKGPFMFRNGVSWPSGRYISIGYAF